MKKKTIKILTIICFVLIIVIINSLLNFWNTPIIDCTQDKKYTLSEETQEILSKVEDKIFFKIYFEGKGFTEEMQNYRNEIERLLIKLQYYSPLIEYDFVDINSYDNENTNSEERKMTNTTEKVIEKIYEDGVIVTENPNIKNNYVPWGGYITYGKYNYEKPLLLLSDLDAMKDIRCAESLNDYIFQFNNRSKDAINKV